MSAPDTASRPSKARDPYVPYRSLIPSDRVRELSRLRPRRAVLDTAIAWACILGAWTAAALWTEWWVVVIAAVIVGTRFYALLIIGHDGLHRRLLPDRRLNDLFNDVFCVGVYGAITRINNTNHLLHHRHLATEDDPDRHRHSCANKATRPAYTAFLSGLANIIPAAANVFVRKPGEAAKTYRPRDLAIIGLWQVALIGGLTLAIGWWAYPALYLAPVYVFTYLGDMVRSFLEHSHPESDEKADEHRLITYTSNPVERFFFAPHNMNFHAAHHLWMSIPYYNLPAADRELRAHPGSEGLVWRRSYVAYLLRYFFALPLPECRPQAHST